MGLFYKGGGERTVLNEAISLQSRGYKVEIFCPTLSKDCFPELVKDVTVHELCWWIHRQSPCRNAMGMLLTSVLSPVLLKSFKGFDVVLAHSQPSNWLACQVKRKYNIPYVSYLHQANRFLYPRNIDRLTGWSLDPNMDLINKIHKLKSLINRLDAISIKNSDYVLVNSKWIKDKVNKIYDVNPQVCYPGVDLSRFNKMASVEEMSKEPFILSTNRHYPQKGLHLLFKSFSTIIGEYPDIKCLITGSYSKYTRQLMDYVDRLKISDNVIFTDNLNESELLDVYKKAYIYSYTSPEEDFGLGPVEAGACGVPSIVWDHAGPRETVMDGETGFRVRPYDLDEFTDKQLLLLDDISLRCKLGNQASKFVRENFSWEKHVDIIESVLDAVIK
jgi:alpha-1,3/alpha-1,6-mannosyltransferase